MGNAIDETGKRYGKLIVLKRVANTKAKRARFLCKCDCGNECSAEGTKLRQGRKKSCGCDIIDGINKANPKSKWKPHYLKPRWAGMMARCYNKNHKDYHSYGGRGIKVCDEWNSFDNYVRDIEPLMSEAKKKISGIVQVDRINNDGDYCLRNVRVVGLDVQNNNKRTNVFIEIDGVKKTIKQWSQVSGVNYATLRQRYYRGTTGSDLLKRGMVRQT